MNKLKLRFDSIFGAILIISLYGCASAPPLTDAGSRIRMITAEQAVACKFVRVVQYNDLIVAVGKSSTVMRAIGDTNLRNAVAATGANAFVLTKDESSWFVGSVAFQGDAYSCP